MGWKTTLLVLSSTEVNKVTKELLVDDIDSDNETNSESEEDTPATFAREPIVAYLDNPDCYNFPKNDDQWVLNENVNFNYSLYFVDVSNPVNTGSLHMPLHML